MYSTAGMGTGLTPELSLELRIRWLEALVNGVKNDRTNLRAAGGDNEEEGSVKERSARRNPEGIGERGETIARKLGEIQAGLSEVIEQNETLKLFIKYYDSSNRRYLTPSFALNDLTDQSGNFEQPALSMMSPSEFEIYLKDIEPEIKQAERDLREIDSLEKRGVSAAGALGAHEELQPRLEALLAAHGQDAQKAAQLESRIILLLDRYTYKTDTLSELFVEWNDVLHGVEEKVKAMEKAKVERSKMGYE